MDIFKVIANTNNWAVIVPEIALGVLALVILLLDCFSQSRKAFAFGVALIGQILILGVCVIFFEPVSEEYFGGLILVTSLTQVMRMFFLLSSILVTYLAYIYFKKQDLAQSEFYVLNLIITGALMLLVESNHFVMLFVALETVTVGLLILVAYCRTSAFSLEAGLKYLILAALSSGLLLFGIVLLYGIAGNGELVGSTNDSMNFVALTRFIEANASNIIVKLGIILILSGVAFKIGIFPFQIWIPDVYQGAPTPVTALLAVSSKAAGVIILMNLFQGPFLATKSFFTPLLSAIAVITIFFGNVAAVSQTNVKRIMGLSGISHAGYLLLGVIASFYVQWAGAAVIFYLFTYLLGSFAVFAVMAHVAGTEDEEQSLYDYENLGKKSPLLGITLLVGLGSLAGIPPLAGFIGKLFLFIAAFQAKLYFLLAVAILGVIISIYYYFGWLREAFFYLWTDCFEKKFIYYQEKKSLSFAYFDRIILGIIIVVTLLLGIYQGAVGGLIF